MAYEASGMENEEYRHNASRKMVSKEVMRNWIWGSDRQTSGLSSRFTTVRCSPSAPLHRNIELHQTGAPRSHDREHCRFETASALKRGANVRGSPLAPSLTRPFTIGPALRDLNRVFSTSAVTESFCICLKQECAKVVETSSVILRPLLGAGYSSDIVWSREIRESPPACTELILDADPGERVFRTKKVFGSIRQIHTN